MSQRIRGCGAVGIALLLVASALAADPTPRPASELFRRENLFAWCIVPFDAKKRGPEERAAMLERLGFKSFAYDYRAEHIPTFDAEIEALQKHHIRLLAWWFPTQLNDEARLILSVLEKHHIETQLWVMGGGAPTTSADAQHQRVDAEAARIRPIAEAAQKIGCQVGLYNHGGWFGEPENQLAILKALNMPNVGIVYNLHHGHEHLGRFPDLLQLMKPHLLALSLNGMDPEGQKHGRQILPIGTGQLDLQLLRMIRESGWHGPIGILNHTDLDAEARLQDNLKGLDWLAAQLDGTSAGPAPTYRTAPPAPKDTPAPHNR